MHATIRRYQVEPGSVDEVTRGINEGFLPIIRDASGFQAYYVVDAGDGRLETVSVFEDRKGAEESTRMASVYISENMASLLPDSPEVLQGEVVAQEAASTLPVTGVTDPVRGVTDKLLGGEEKKR